MDDSQDINIGVVEAYKSIENFTCWWSYDYGYSYWGTSGDIYHSGADPIEYGEEFGQGDVIDVYLDLNQEHRDLSFAKNDKHFGTGIIVKMLHKYKLALGSSTDSLCKIELLSFDVH